MDRKQFQIRPPEITKPPTFPWYKERLLTKCLRDPKNKRHLSGALDSRRWRFLEADLNDFSGYPTHTSKNILTQGHRTTRPAPNLTVSLDEEHAKRLSKEQACFSKQTARQQARSVQVTAVEQKLTQHPLALYPHLEQGMPPELFDQVISVLEPDMCANRPSTGTSSETGDLKEEEEEEEENDSPELCETQMQEPGKEGTPIDETSGNSGPKNPYKDLLAGESVAKEHQIVSVKRVPSISQDEDIKKVTKLFCDWVASLGGESVNLTESSLQKLFVSSLSLDEKLYPAQPKNGINPKSYPDKLCTSKELQNDHARDARLKASVPVHKRPLGMQRCKYGAWYLDPKTWRKRYLNEPEDLEDYELSEAQSERDKALKQMHGTQAFRQFIITKGLRVPQFLSELFAEEEGGNDVGSASTRSAPTRKGKVGL